MALEDVVNLVITRTTRALERPGFGTLLVLGAHRQFEDRYRLYTDVDGLTNDRFTANDPVLRAAQAYFSQDPKPRRLAVGRRATASTMTFTVSTVRNSTEYAVFVDGIRFAFTSDATATAAEIAAGLSASLMAGLAVLSKDAALETITLAVALGDIRAQFPAGRRFKVTGDAANAIDFTVAAGGATFNGTSTVIPVVENVAVQAAAGAVQPRVNSTAAAAVVTLTPVNAAGGAHTDYWTFSGNGDLTATLPPNTTATADLNAVRDASDDFYFIVETTRAEVEQLDLAARAEQLRKLLVVADNDAEIIDLTQANDSPLTGSVARQAQGRAYARTAVAYSARANGTPDGTTPDTFADAAWVGTRATTDPGSESWKFMSLSGIVADNLTATQRANALAKGANVYVPITASRSITEDGTVANGEYIDIIRFADWLHSEMTREVFDALANPPAPLNKIPYDDGGIAVVKAAVLRTLEAGTRRGGFARRADGTGEYDVTVPLVADTALADRAARILRDVRFTGRLAGAIHAVVITGRVAV